MDVWKLLFHVKALVGMSAILYLDQAKGKGQKD